VKRIITTSEAPAAIGPYSQGISVEGGRWIFTSGQIALDPKTGKLVEGGIAEQTARVLENLKAVLSAGGASLGDVVKTTVYLVDLGDFQTMNDVYARYFHENPPARSTVQVSRLPRDARIEMEAVAVVK